MPQGDRPFSFVVYSSEIRDFGFYIDVYTPLIESLKARLPQYRFETKEISHADAMKPESVEI